MTQIQIVQDPFVLGSGQNKHPGGYISRVTLNGKTYETLDPTPNMGRLACIWWCMTEPPVEVIPQPPVPDVSSIPVSSGTGSISG